MKTMLLAAVFLWAAAPSNVQSATIRENGLASWYGEAHRGKRMANGRKFDPDKLTAASWFYPLGTKVRVIVDSPGQPQRTVSVTITDRGPAWRLVHRKRIIDLTLTAFKELAEPDLGLVAVKVERED